MREKEMFIEANQMFESYFALISDDQWEQIVPSASDWTVHKLVSHVIENNIATAAILSGTSPEPSAHQTSKDFDVAWTESAQAAELSVSLLRNGEQKVMGPLGEMSANSFIQLMTVDRTVHAWDLAKAIHADTKLIPEVAAAAYEWVQAFAPTLYEAGEFGEPLAVAGDATSQERLLAITGREPS